MSLEDDSYTPKRFRSDEAAAEYELRQFDSVELDALDTSDVGDGDVEIFDQRIAW